MATEPQASIIARIDVVLAELRELQVGPYFKIAHRFQRALLGCEPGEEVWSVFLIYRGREYPIPFSLALLLLFDYLARTRHSPQLATQIAAGLRRSEFVQLHGANAGAVQIRKYSGSAIKEYIKRMRQALGKVFAEAGLPIAAERVIRSEATDGNGVRYCIKASVDWVHLRDELEDSVGNLVNS